MDNWLQQMQEISEANKRLLSKLKHLNKSNSRLLNKLEKNQDKNGSSINASSIVSGSLFEFNIDQQNQFRERMDKLRKISESLNNDII